MGTKDETGGNMNCQMVRRKLYDYMDKRLAEKEAQPISHHLKECVSCARLFVFEEKLKLTLQEKMKEEAVPAGLRETILQQCTPLQQKKPGFFEKLKLRVYSPAPAPAASAPLRFALVAALTILFVAAPSVYITFKKHPVVETGFPEVYASHLLHCRECREEISKMVQAHMFVHKSLTMDEIKAHILACAHCRKEALAMLKKHLKEEKKL